LGSNTVGVIVLAILRSLAWFLYWIPSAVREGLADILGWVLQTFGLRSRVIAENLQIAFPGESFDAVQKREALYASAYRHLGHLVLEILMLLGPMKKYSMKYTDFHGLEHWEKAKKKGKGVLFVASHVGNWEIMTARGALSGIDILLVTKHLKPEWLHRAIEEGRARCNVRATYEPRTLRDVIFHLRRNGTVGFVLDQYTGPPVGVRVPVFGVPVGTSLALATLAKRTGAVVLPVLNYRAPSGRLVVEIQPEVEWQVHENPQLELAQNTARYAQILEGHIRSYPEQWLWTHRRFKGDLTPLRRDEWLEGRARK
jgi:Kdo2-lipid IVA lauroyltransferase/acyltransferase